MRHVRLTVVHHRVHQVDHGQPNMSHRRFASRPTHGDVGGRSVNADDDAVPVQVVLDMLFSLVTENVSGRTVVVVRLVPDAWP